MSALLKAKFVEELYPVQLEDEHIAETEKHISAILDLIQQLRTYFQNEQVYVIGDMTFYYQENSPKQFIVPDVFVTKGISKEARRVYKLWEEKVPDVVFEISSRKTWGADLNQKWSLYQRIGVKEYYIFDPEYDYLPEPLVGYHLNLKGEFKKIKLKRNRIFSPALDLELVATDEGLRLFNIQKGEFLKNNIELTNENAYLADANIHLADANSNLADANIHLETENETLKGEIERLKLLLKK